jgi:putative ABC transport system ATP-binding protein
LPSEDEIVRCEQVVKTYRTSSGEVRALRGVDATFPRGALVAVAGPSGSGKSSLLRLIAGMDRPTSGTVTVSGISVGSASTRIRRRLRRDRVGYVFQRPSDNFLPHLSVGEHLQRVAEPSANPEAALEALGIAGRAEHRPAELSGGEQQRAAFAQALVSGADVVVADEPTAELDTASADAVLEAVRLLRETGVTFVLATHDPSVMRAADVMLRLDHGEVVDPHRQPPSGAVGPPRYGPPGEDVPMVLGVDEVVKTYLRGTDVVHAVEDVTLDVREGELVGLVGRSGSGKTTLLNMVSGWEHADAGLISHPGRGVDGTTAWRDLAIVPQRLGLMDELTVRENVSHPARLGGTLDEHADRVEALLEELGLAHLADRRPSETSVGEQQRTAIARALLLRPSLVVADEPTGHQDRGWTEKVFAALRTACDEGTACLMATHDETATRFLDRALSIRDGRLTADLLEPEGGRQPRWR